ncbi:MAG: ABC transporter permease [Elusimicrobiales bacterium]|nr:ABC transporter permease [Elusimicrobiales bacterium]
MNNFIEKIFSHKSAKFGVSIIILYVLIAVISPIIAPPYKESDPYIVKQHGFEIKPQKPSSKYLFGTTQNQYDIFYAMVWGTRLAFKISIAVVVISFLIGIILGGISGYYGGVIDEIIMRFTDIILSIPSLVLAMIVAVVLGPGIENVVVAVTCVWWPSYARMFRSEVLKIRNSDYVIYSKISGGNTFWIFRKHILPNSIYPIIIMASLDIANVVLLASSLSFLGIGSPPGYADWGQMISMSRNWIVSSFSNPLSYAHTVVIPSLFIFFFVFGFNLVGESARDILDPKIKT